MSKVGKLFGCVAAIVTIGGAGTFAAGPANAAMVTIYPNYSDNLCLNAGKVKMVQVAAIPGNSTNWRPGSWSSVTAPAYQNVRVIGNIQCVRSLLKGGGGYYRVVDRKVYVQPNKSYYF